MALVLSKGGSLSIVQCCQCGMRSSQESEATGIFAKSGRIMKKSLMSLALADKAAFTCVTGKEEDGGAA